MDDERSALVDRLAGQLTRVADSVAGEWDGFSVVAEITALGVRVTGFRYLEDRPGLPMLMDNDVIETVAELRRASAGANGEMFDVFVARLDRSTGELAGNAFTAQDGARFRVTAAHIRDVAELVRPGTSLDPTPVPQPEPQPEPVPEPPVEPEPQPERQPERQPEPESQRQPESRPPPEPHPLRAQP